MTRQYPTAVLLLYSVPWLATTACNVVQAPLVTKQAVQGAGPRTAEVPSTIASKTMSEVKVAAQLLISDLSPTVSSSPDPTKRSKREQLCHKATAEANQAIQFADWAPTPTTTAPSSRPNLPQAELETKAREHLAAATDLTREANADKAVLYSPWFRAHTGAATRSPYTLAKNTATGLYELQKSKTTTDFYAEIDFLNRNAWLEPKQRISPTGTGESPQPLSRLAPHDLELRLGFINGTTSIDSSSSAAGGDWYANTSIGWNILGYNITSDPGARDDPGARGTVNFELAGDFITARNDLRVNGSYYAGIGSAWALPIDVDSKFRMATLFGGIYLGIHEYPRIDFDNVVYSSNARPTYMRLGTFAARLEFTIPLTQRLEAIVRGSLATPLGRYDLPDDWSLFVGASFPIGKIVRDILGSN